LNCGDISGKGISAALLMATIHSAVRVYEFGGVPGEQVLAAAGVAATSASRSPLGIAGGDLRGVNGGGIQSPSEVMWLLNRHLFHSTPPEKYATLFLAIYNGYERKLSYTNAGHLAPIILSPDGSVRRCDCGGTVIGLFEEASYEQASIELSSGDLLIAYSDGITEPENEFGEFGEARLLEVLRENKNLPLPRLSETVITAVTDWTGGGEQPDDITLVLARAG
jgi:sigma-B regulation protein RsbU (phosphoserine phosphatase)